MNDFRETAMFSNVLVGVDGRQGGRDAIALAIRLAGPGATTCSWSARATAEDLARLGGADDLEGQVSYGSPGEKHADFSAEVA